MFPEVHLPLRKGYVSVEELVRDPLEVSHNKRVSFNHFPLFTRGSFPRRGKITALTNFRLLTTPWELAGNA